MEAPRAKRGLTEMGPRLSIVPAAACTDPSLRGPDLRVLCLFGRHTDEQGWCSRSQVKMAKELGVSRSTVQRSIKRLVLCKYLERRVLKEPHEKGDRDRPHEYRVVLGTKDRKSLRRSDWSGDTAAHSERAPPARSRRAPKNDTLRTTTPQPPFELGRFNEDERAAGHLQPLIRSADPELFDKCADLNGNDQAKKHRYWAFRPDLVRQATIELGRVEAP